MIPAIIKLMYGYTIDLNNTEDEPCPKCGGVVCHVKENSHKVFCTNSLCSFQDETNDNWDKPIIDRFKYMIKYPPVFLYRLDYNYSSYKHPFLMEEDLQQGKIVVRDFRLDEERYYSKAARWAGLSKKQCYQTNSPIIARYSTIDLLVKDGWRIEEDPDL